MLEDATVRRAVLRQLSATQADKCPQRWAVAIEAEDERGDPYEIEIEVYADSVEAQALVNLINRVLAWK